MVIAVPELEEEHDGGLPLFLRPWEIIHDEVPALRYFMRIRLVEIQDWHTLPPSSDDDFDSGDSGNSNFNGYHPGFGIGGGGRHPRTTSFCHVGDPQLGLGWALGRHAGPWVHRGPSGVATCPAPSSSRAPPYPVAPSTAGLRAGRMRQSRRRARPWCQRSRRRACPSPVRHRLTLPWSLQASRTLVSIMLTLDGRMHAHSLLSALPTRIQCWTRLNC